MLEEQPIKINKTKRDIDTNLISIISYWITKKVASYPQNINTTHDEIIRLKRWSLQACYSKWQFNSHIQYVGSNIIIIPEQLRKCVDTACNFFYKLR
jgi:hypothetical protein